MYDRPRRSSRGQLNLFYSIITGNEKFTIIKELKLRFYASSVSLERFH
jgi:hypothetical protein